MGFFTKAGKRQKEMADREMNRRTDSPKVPNHMNTLNNVTCISPIECLYLSTCVLVLARGQEPCFVLSRSSNFAQGKWLVSHRWIIPTNREKFPIQGTMGHQRDISLVSGIPL